MTIFSKHSQEYSEENFWKKLGKIAAKVGIKVVYAALLLYYTLQVPSLPSWAKGVIIGALGYFIFPADALPDFFPAVGYTDDFGVLALALLSVAMHIDNNIKAKAREKIKETFGDKINMEELFEVEKNLHGEGPSPS